MWDWIGDNAIALIAAVGAFIGWFENHRRIVRSEVDFRIERHEKYDDWFWLINEGTRRVAHTEIDPSSVIGFHLKRNVFVGMHEPKQPVMFMLGPSDSGEMPKTLRVNYKFGFSGRVRSVIVPLPARSEPPSPGTEG